MVCHQGFIDLILISNFYHSGYLMTNCGFTFILLNLLVVLLENIASGDTCLRQWYFGLIISPKIRL